MRCCHRANASLKCCGEIRDRSGPLPGMGDDSSHGRESVFDAMVEFGIQDFAGLLGSLALGNVDVDADHPLGVPRGIVRDEAARLNPSQPAIRANNSVLKIMFAPPVA